MTQTHNIHIEQISPLISPMDLKGKLPGNPYLYEQIARNRQVIKDILTGKDSRLLAIVGPCSIHDTAAAMDYAHRLKALSKKVESRLFVIMRVYFEKPRTTIGWKGLINDPDLNDTRDMSKGLHVARKLLIDIAELDLPIATEVLDPITPQYISDLISWASIGARTTESQTHREMASGLSMPVGFKNGTDGDIGVAIAAMQSAQNPHSFIGIDDHGKTAIIRTKGNMEGHVILRGGRNAPNYDAQTIRTVVDALQKVHLNSHIVIDCSHANSSKDYQNQPVVLKNILEQRQKGNNHIIGFMLESNIAEGSQKIPSNLSELKYGVSVTDACIGWESTESLLLGL